jgi:hypothetical protein
MKLEINIPRMGDYGLLFVDLLDALIHPDDAAIGTVCEQMAKLARQKTLEKEANAAGVRLTGR